MDRLMKWKRVLMERNEGDGNSLGGGGSHSEDPGNPPNPDSNSNPSPSDTGDGGQSPFNHPSLRGRSEEEIARLLEVSEATIREQGRNLSMMNRRIQEIEQSSPRRDDRREDERQTPFEEPDPQEFWKSPYKHVNQAVQQSEQRILNALQEVIKPFRESYARTAKEQAFEEIRKEFDDFGRYEALINTLLMQSGVPDDKVTPESIRYLYYTAYGIAQRKAEKEGGGNMREGNGGNDGGNGNNNARRDPPPQHRASNQPVNRAPNRVTVRELDENEKTIARMKGMTDEQFLSWMEFDGDNLLTVERPK